MYGAVQVFWPMEEVVVVERATGRGGRMWMGYDLLGRLV